jgi:hypothetical protein
MIKFFPSYFLQTIWLLRKKLSWVKFAQRVARIALSRYCRETTGEIFKNAQGFNWSNLYQASEFVVDHFIMECLPSQASVDQLTEAQTLRSD